jgi:sugar lactone lactonase YvrE
MRVTFNFLTALELHKMPSFACTVSRAIRCSLIATATVLIAGAHAWGQAGPQLLPYTVTTIAGNAPTTPAVTLPTYAVGTACPSGNGRVATDTVGDGCLATEVALSQPRYATEDAQGNIYFSDSTNARIRRIEMNSQATLGVITTYAGGAASSPTSTATCKPLGTTVTDTLGDGNVATSLKLTTPSGLIFDSTGNLYFADSGTDTVRKIDATTKIVTLIAGNCASTYGYATNSTTPAVTINAATQSYLDFPYGLALDGKGALFIADEGNQAVEAVNLLTTPITVNGVTIPAGTIAKVLGYGSLNAKTATNPASTTDCPNFTAAATGSRGGCYYPAANALVSGYSGVANSTNLDNPYDVAVDAAGNLYVNNTYPYQAVVVNSAGMASEYAGVSNSKLSTSSLKRGPAQTVPLGSTYGLSLDKSVYPSAPNLYISDGSNGMVWRVDASTKGSYQVAGASSTLCTLALDTIGDGCNANNATFSLYSSTTVYGIDGLFADSYSNLLVADARNNLIREISSGTQFGTINGSKPVQTLEVHFDAGDTFSSSVAAATITAGASNFTVGSFATANCTTNSDTTTDCLLTLQANPTTAGAFTGTLQIVSSLGRTSTFPLNGYYVNFVSPTKTFISFTAGGCAVTTAGSGSPTIITAKVKGQVNGVATGNVQFFVDSVQVGTAALDATNKAVYSYTFPVGTHSVYATYVGDPNFATSTSTPAASITSSVPTFAISSNSLPYASAVTGLNVVAGGSGYTSAPTVTISGGGGSGATATATFSLAGLTLGSGGSGYTSAPAVTISGGGGSNALAIATVSGGAVTGIVLASSGYGYTSVPTVTFATNAGGSGATATASLTGAITGFNVVGGSGYSTAPTVAITGGSGTGAIATASIVTLLTCVVNGVTMAPCVSAGQTALYAFSVTPVAYTGLISFSCSGLPAGAACIFYPGDPSLANNTIAVTPCGGPYTESLSITTTQPQPVTYGVGAFGKGKWGVFGLLPAMLMGMLLMFRRRKSSLKYSGALMALAFLIAMASAVGCGKDFGGPAPGTPSGTSTITVTGVTANGLTQTQTVTLTVK